MKYQKRFPIILDNEDNIEKFCINAKDLYKEIIQSEDTSNFSRWIKRAIKNYGFTENTDFSTISPIGRIGNKSLIAQGGDIKSTTYILSVDMSKQLAMIDKKETGFITRKYFILMENIVTKNKEWLAIRDPEKEEYKKILDKFVTYIPQSSVIGRLLEHKEKNIVVKSTERGIMQHDIYSWQINAKYAITELQVTKESDLVRNIIRTWLEDTTPEQRKNVIDIIYNILVSADATTMRDLSSAKVKSLGRILKLYNKVDENDKKLILKVFASLGTATKQNLKTREPKKEIILNKKKIWTKGNI